MKLNSMYPHVGLLDDLLDTPKHTYTQIQLIVTKYLRCYLHLWFFLTKIQIIHL